MPTTIYALCEPGTRTVRYIGKTVDLKRRFRGHLRESSKQANHLGSWLRSLSAHGEIPNVVTLREVPESEGAAAEIKYIRIARKSLGMDLVNATDGGEGTTGCIKSPETRAKISAAKTGVPHTPEHRARRSAWMTGRTLPIEWRASMSRVRIGVPRPPGTAAKISAAKTGRRQSEETRAKKRAAQQRRRAQEKLQGKKGAPWSAARWAAFQKRKQETN